MSALEMAILSGFYFYFYKKSILGSKASKHEGAVRANFHVE